MYETAGVRKQALQIDVDTGNQYLRQRTINHLQVFFTAQHRRDHNPFQFLAGHRIGHIGTQDRMRADLHEYVVALLGERLTGGLEQHRITNVFPPVPGVQMFTGQHVAGHGRIHWNTGVTRDDVAQHVDDLIGDHIHGRRVERIIETQAANEYLTLGQRVFQGF
ncbi:hypothetical protein D3C85_579870 [compost metagenome]